MKTIRLVTRADDAGLNRTTNRAIRATAKQGIVKNISLLAVAPAIDDAAEVLRDLAGSVDFGLHACLTSEWRHPKFRPLSRSAAAESLVRKDGSFPATIDELASLLPDADGDADAVAVEMAAQLDRIRKLGFEPTYLDEHMLFGSVDGLASVLVSFAKEHGLIYDRSLIERKTMTRLPGWSGPGPHPGTELADHLSSLDAGTYLIVGHPGFKADEMQRLRHESEKGVDVLLDHNRQRRMFADIEIVDYCENAGVELLRYSDI